MLKDGRDKEHSADLDTIIAGFLQSVRAISFPHSVVVFFGYPKTADIRIVDKNPVLARLQELSFIGFMRQGSKGKGVLGNPIIIWKD